MTANDEIDNPLDVQPEIKIEDWFGQQLEKKEEEIKTKVVEVRGPPTLTQDQKEQFVKLDEIVKNYKIKGYKAGEFKIVVPPPDMWPTYYIKKLGDNVEAAEVIIISILTQDWWQTVSVFLAMLESETAYNYFGHYDEDEEEEDCGESAFQHPYIEQCRFSHWPARVFTYNAENPGLRLWTISFTGPVDREYLTLYVKGLEMRAQEIEKEARGNGGFLIEDYDNVVSILETKEVL